MNSFERELALCKKILDEAEKAESLTPEEQALYDRALRNYRDYRNTIDYAFEKGELNKQRQIAKSSKDAGLPVMFIQTHTGLSKEEIEAL